MSKTVIPLVKCSLIMPTTVTWDCTCLTHLGRHDTSRNDPKCVIPPKVAKASTLFMFMQETLLMYVSLKVCCSIIQKYLVLEEKRAQSSYFQNF